MDKRTPNADKANGRKRGNRGKTKKSTTKEGTDFEDKDEKKKLEESKAELEPLIAERLCAALSLSQRGVLVVDVRALEAAAWEEEGQARTVHQYAKNLFFPEGKRIEDLQQGDFEHLAELGRDRFGAWAEVEGLQAAAIRGSKKTRQRTLAKLLELSLGFLKLLVLILVLKVQTLFRDALQFFVFPRLLFFRPFVLSLREVIL